MSNLKRSFLLILIAIVITITNGCKKDDNPLTSGDELVGTWVLTKLIVTYPQPQGKTEMTPQQANMTMTIIIKSDRTYQRTQNAQGQITNENGTWSVSNGTLTAVSTSGTLTFAYRVNGNILQLDTTVDDPQTGNSLPTTLEFTKQ